jgi:hypothetical protein
MAPNIDELPSYANGTEKLTSSHFRAFHYLPEDNKKLIEIHYLVYNLYCEI